MNVRIGVSQRVTLVTEYGERRDALDQRWIVFLTSCGFLPILIPNHPPTADLLLKEIPLDGFLLTGGNNLVEMGGDSPERDATELILLEHARKRQKPLMGVCRGMQFLQNYFGVKLETVSGHVAVGHRISGQGIDRTVNSYHQIGTQASHPELTVLARAKDGIVEAIQHVSAPLRGIMWHPERYEPFVQSDLNLFRDFFHGRSSTLASRYH
jgi:putative glutamine amidotransferase